MELASKDIKDGQGYGWSLPDGVNPNLDWDKLIEAKNAEDGGLKDL